MGGERPTDPAPTPRSPSEPPGGMSREEFEQLLNDPARLAEVQDRLDAQTRAATPQGQRIHLPWARFGLAILLNVMLYVGLLELRNAPSISAERGGGLMQLVLMTGGLFLLSIGWTAAGMAVGVRSSVPVMAGLLLGVLIGAGQLLAFAEYQNTPMKPEHWSQVFFLLTVAVAVTAVASAGAAALHRRRLEQSLAARPKERKDD